LTATHSAGGLIPIPPLHSNRIFQYFLLFPLNRYFNIISIVFLINRSETPLIYRAVPSWFIRVEMIVQQLLENNNKCYWVPEFVQAKRFANWLTNARDWAVSRNRYWGTPIPIWASEDFSEVVCVGSVEELEQLSGVRVSDLHRENVDHITIPSCRGNGVLKRVSEVFDCWFESGSMPYAQSHYPFENKKVFETTFPADFIAEGVDQTRGWFYTLLVVSTALFNKPPYKNLIVNGLVLASNGQKMSKRLKNYPDPMNVVKDYGADALRLYLVNSPVVRAESLRFQEKGVKDVVKDVFLPWFNAYRFLIQNVLRLKQEEGISFVHTADFSPANTMDRWIISFTQSLVFFMKEEMAKYRLYYCGSSTGEIHRPVDKLGELGKHECLDSMHTLFSVLYSMTRMLAPFTPFLTEHMFQNLRHLLPWELNDSNASLHYIMMPKPRPDLIDKEIERAVSLMQSVVETGRYIRDKVVVPIKFPLPEVVVIHRDPGSHDDLKKLENYILEISYAVAESLSSRYHAHASGTLLVLLDATPSQEMVDEGVAREVINKIQKLRKKAGLQPRDAVEVLYKVGGEGGGASLTRVIENHREYIETTTKGPVNPWTSTSDLSHKIVEEEQKMKGLADVMLHLWIIPKPESSSGTNSIPLVDPVPNGDGPIPVCRYVNLVLFLPPGPTLRPAGLLATLLLENPVGENILTLNQLKTEVCNLLKSYLNRDLHIWVVAGGNTEPVTSSCDLLSLHRQTCTSVRRSGPLPVDCGFPPTEPLTPFSKFVDVTLDNGRQATVMLENPKGVKIIAEKDAKIVAKQLF
ncbi:Isoleucine--tRNA ligase, cytoplasmic, partial [Geodia barretti]